MSQHFLKIAYARGAQQAMRDFGVKTATDDAILAGGLGGMGLGGLAGAGLGALFKRPGIGAVLGALAGAGVGGVAGGEMMRGHSGSGNVWRGMGGDYRKNRLTGGFDHLGDEAGDLGRNIYRGARDFSNESGLGDAASDAASRLKRLSDESGLSDTAGLVGDKAMGAASEGLNSLNAWLKD